jgi:hypothetical protein
MTRTRRDAHVHCEARGVPTQTLGNEHFYLSITLEGAPQ